MAQRGDQKSEKQGQHQKIVEHSPVGGDLPHQRRHEIQPHDEEQEPHVIVSRQHGHGEGMPRPSGAGGQMIQRVDHRPEQEGREDPRDVPGPQAVDGHLLLRIEEQGPGDHDEDGHAPAHQSVPDVIDHPRSALHVHVAPSLDGDVQEHHRHGGDDPKVIQIFDSMVGDRQGFCVWHVECSSFPGCFSHYTVVKNQSKQK